MSGVPAKRPASESQSSHEPIPPQLYHHHLQPPVHPLYPPRPLPHHQYPPINSIEPITDHSVLNLYQQTRHPTEPQPKKLRPSKSTEFSGTVKSKLQTSTRTGQACDRCKVRKIRCDALPDGCSHCMAVNQPCYVTDRVTGRTERRGYLKELEKTVSLLQTRLRDCEALLTAQGIEVYPDQLLSSSPSQQLPPAPAPAPAPSQQHLGPLVPTQQHLIVPRPSTQLPRPPNPADGWTCSGSLWIRHTVKSVTSPPRTTRQSSTPSTSTASPSFMPSRLSVDPTIGHVGASMDFAPLSSVSGTQLHILGTTIETGSFAGTDFEENAIDSGPFTPRNNKSVQALLQSMMNKNKVPDVGLPPREETFTYAEWYFYVQEKFLPMLHKPSFFKMLTRIYDDPHYTPTASESVRVHMVYSTMLFHYGVRNPALAAAKDRYNKLSNAHYHYALSRFYELLCERSLGACQAMALLALHARNFPKPHGAVILATQALGRAWSLGLHRKPSNPNQYTPLERELRNRLWWTIVLLNVFMQAAMGRSMPFTNQDYDVDYPLPINDAALTPEGIDEVAARELPCPFWVGLASFRIMPLFIDLYSQLYAVKRNPALYETLVANLEARLQAWKSQLPTKLVVPPGPLSTLPPDEDPVSILFIQELELQFRFCLRHPSISMNPSPELAMANEAICEGLATEMLTVAINLSELRSLDTTWSSMSLYGAFMFTTLAAHWSRREQASAQSVRRLRQDMEKWLGVISEVGSLLGAGGHAVGKMREIVGRTMAQIEIDSGVSRQRSFDNNYSQSTGVSTSGNMPGKEFSFLTSFPQNSRPGPDPSMAAQDSASHVHQAEAAADSMYYGVDSPSNSRRGSPSNMSRPGSPLEETFPSRHVLMPSYAPPGFASPTHSDDGHDSNVSAPPIKNVWKEWSAAIIDDKGGRYSVSSLADLNNQRSAFSEPGPFSSQPSKSLPVQAQWPLLVYRDPKTRQYPGWGRKDEREGNKHQ